MKIVIYPSKAKVNGPFQLKCFPILHSLEIAVGCRLTKVRYSAVFVKYSELRTVGIQVLKSNLKVLCSDNLWLKDKCSESRQSYFNKNEKKTKVNFCVCLWVGENNKMGLSWAKLSYSQGKDVEKLSSLQFKPNCSPTFYNSVKTHIGKLTKYKQTK